MPRVRRRSKARPIDEDGILHLTLGWPCFGMPFVKEAQRETGIDFWFDSRVEAVVHRLLMEAWSDPRVRSEVYAATAQFPGLNGQPWAASQFD